MTARPGSPADCQRPKGNWRAPAGRNGFKRRQIAEVDFFERIVHRCKLRRRVFSAERDHYAEDYDNDRNQTPGKDEKYLHRRLAVEEPEHRKRSLLRLRRERPCRRRPAEDLDEIAPPHGTANRGLLRASKDIELSSVSQGAWTGLQRPEVPDV